MAEFINTTNQKEQRADDASCADGMNAFGKPVPMFRKIAAEQHCRDMGMDDTAKITGMISRVSEFIARDDPHRALEALMAYVDLTGAYRLLAVMCTAGPLVDTSWDATAASFVG